jgi:hypothetical protein
MINYSTFENLKIFSKNMKKHLKLLVLLHFVPITIVAQYTDEINSNRPGKSMSAFSVGRTVFQAEAGFFGLKEEIERTNYQSEGLGADLSIRYGEFFEQFEMILDLQYQKDWYTTSVIHDTRSALRQTTLGAKYLIYDPFKTAKPDKPNIYSWKANRKAKFNWRDLIPAVGIYGGLNLKLTDNPYLIDDAVISPKGMIITQNHFGTRWVWVNNFILDRFTTDDANIGLVSTLTRGFNIRWTGFLEFQGSKGDYRSDYYARAGAAYLVRENIQLDASIAKKLNNEPDVLQASIGISWRFDRDYEDVYIRIDNSKDKEEKDDKKDKKKDKKKRKDQVELEETTP